MQDCNLSWKPKNSTEQSLCKQQNNHCASVIFVEQLTNQLLSTINTPTADSKAEIRIVLLGVVLLDRFGRDSQALDLREVIANLVAGAAHKGDRLQRHCQVATAFSTTRTTKTADLLQHTTQIGRYRDSPCRVKTYQWRDRRTSWRNEKTCTKPGLQALTATATQGSCGA